MVSVTIFFAAQVATLATPWQVFDKACIDGEVLLASGEVAQVPVDSVRSGAREAVRAVAASPFATATRRGGPALAFSKSYRLSPGSSSFLLLATDANDVSSACAVVWRAQSYKQARNHLLGPERAAKYRVSGGTEQPYFSVDFPTHRLTAAEYRGWTVMVAKPLGANK